MLGTNLEGNRSDLKIFLPARDFEKSLTGTIWYPNPVCGMCLFGTGVASTLLLIDPSVPLFAMLSHQA
jgi:hypothetical protein